MIIKDFNCRCAICPCFSLCTGIHIPASASTFVLYIAGCSVGHTTVHQDGRLGSKRIRSGLILSIGFGFGFWDSYLLIATLTASVQLLAGEGGWWRWACGGGAKVGSCDGSWSRCLLLGEGQGGKCAGHQSKWVEHDVASSLLPLLFVLLFCLPLPPFFAMGVGVDSCVLCMLCPCPCLCLCLCARVVLWVWACLADWLIDWFCLFIFVSSGVAFRCCCKYNCNLSTLTLS